MSASLVILKEKVQYSVLIQKQMTDFHRRECDRFAFLFHRKRNGKTAEACDTI